MSDTIFKLISLNKVKDVDGFFVIQCSVLMSDKSETLVDVFKASSSSEFRLLQNGQRVPLGLEENFKYAFLAYEVRQKFAKSGGYDK